MKIYSNAKAFIEIIAIAQDAYKRLIEYGCSFRLTFLFLLLDHSFHAMLVYCTRSIHIDSIKSVSFFQCWEREIERKKQNKKVWIPCRLLINICKQYMLSKQCLPNKQNAIESCTQKLHRCHSFALCNGWRVWYESKSVHRSHVRYWKWNYRQRSFKSRRRTKPMHLTTTKWHAAQRKQIKKITTITAAAAPGAEAEVVAATD